MYLCAILLTVVNNHVNSEILSFSLAVDGQISSHWEWTLKKNYVEKFLRLANAQLNSIRAIKHLLIGAEVVHRRGVGSCSITPQIPHDGHVHNLIVEYAWSSLVAALEHRRSVCSKACGPTGPLRGVRRCIGRTSLQRKQSPASLLQGVRTSSRCQLKARLTNAMGCPSCSSTESFLGCSSTESFLRCIALNHLRFPVVVGQDVTKSILLSLRSEKGLLRCQERKGSIATANRVSVASQSSGATTEGFRSRATGAKSASSWPAISNHKCSCWVLEKECFATNRALQKIHHKKRAIRSSTSLSIWMWSVLTWCSCLKVCGSY